MKRKSFLYFYFIIFFSSSLPIFDIKSLNQDECEKTGKIILNGKILRAINRNINFNLPFEEPSGVTLN